MRWYFRRNVFFFFSRRHKRKRRKKKFLEMWFVDFYKRIYCYYILLIHDLHLLWFLSFFLFGIMLSVVTLIRKKIYKKLFFSAWSCETSGNERISRVWQPIKRPYVCGEEQNEEMKKIILFFLEAINLLT